MHLLFAVAMRGVEQLDPAKTMLWMTLGFGGSIALVAVSVFLHLRWEARQEPDLEDLRFS